MRSWIDGLALSKSGDMGLGGFMRASWAAFAAVMLTATSAQAEAPIGFLVCQPGGPRLDAEQTAVMDRLFRHLEKKMKLAEGRFKGHYANTAKGCEKALADRPSVIFPSLPIFIEKRRELKLEPVAQLRINGSTKDHFYVIVKKDASLTVAGLADKTVMGTHLDSPRFLTDAVFWRAAQARSTQAQADEAVAAGHTSGHLRQSRCGGARWGPISGAGGQPFRGRHKAPAHIAGRSNAAGDRGSRAGG